jgi:hypothetical protein
LDSGGNVRVILEQIAQLAGPNGEILRHICKEFEELRFAREKADHKSGEIS